MTGRLIEADKAIEATWEQPTYTDPLNVLTEVRDRIKELPTVEAIPVEWINKYTNEHRTYMHAFSEMVACWYDEKEKREYERASDMRDYCERYEPTYNPEDGSL